MSELAGILSERLWTAERTRQPIAPLTSTHPELSVSQAYAVAELTRQRRGCRRVGYKLGYTSAAMREQMNIDAPNYGVLTEDLMVPEGNCRVDTENLIHPRVEPEIALLVGRDLEPGTSRAGVFAAVDAVMAALEIVDTRYESYVFKAVDNIADNSSSARFVLGAPRRLSAIEDLRLCGVILSCGGAAVDQGVGANALGDPLLALCWLTNELAARKERLLAGSIILTGGLTKSHPGTRGSTFIAEFGGLGTVAASF